MNDVPYERGLRRRFVEGRNGDILYFPWGKFGSGYIVPSSDEKEEIIRKKLLRSKRQMWIAVFVVPVGYAPVQYGRTGLIISLTGGGGIICYMVLQSYFDNRKWLKGYPKTDEKYQGTPLAIRVAENADQFSKSKLISMMCGYVLMSGGGALCGFFSKDNLLRFLGFLLMAMGVFFIYVTVIMWRAKKND
jgi:hypothetical protein